MAHLNNKKKMCHLTFISKKCCIFAKNQSLTIPDLKDFEPIWVVEVRDSYLYRLFLFKKSIMNVTIFKNVKQVQNGFDKPVLDILNRIKIGKSKEKVLWLREQNKEIYQKNKGNLPSVCFNGTFSHRSLKGLTEKSGLIILDFDKFSSEEEAIIFKESIISIDYIFSAWISPSGLGVKVLVKIPVDEMHKEYFDSLKLFFNSTHWDDAGSDISRLCFESYDPEIYINTDSKVWDAIELPEIEDVGVSFTTIPVVSDNRIIDNLLKWWKGKYGTINGERNVNLFKLAIAFNEFGIAKSEAENVLSQFCEKDFSIVEVRNIIKSAYKRVSIHGTKFFEDNNLKEKIQKQIIAGKKTKDIESMFPEVANVNISQAIEEIRENISVDCFWQYDKNGKISLIPHQFRLWLQQSNFFKYFPNNSQTYSFIYKEKNLIEETSEKRIKDYTLNYLDKLESEGYKPYDFMCASTKYFSSDFLSFLESAEIILKEDTPETCYLYYRNCVVEITKDSINQIDYIDIDGFVWKNQVIDRDYIVADHHTAIFRDFIYKISGQNMEKYNSFKSVIGYLLHSFKTSSNNKAIILNDETITESPNGGSGKGLFCQAIGMMKKVATIDGKTFTFEKSFPYQTVSTDTQVLVFDDTKKNFNFESLFSLITEGITLEYKGQDAIKINVKKSPKIVITTNYTIGGVGGSFDRRKFEVELSNFFGANHSPIDQYNHMFFDDWDEQEFARFDNFMINCEQYYLNNGLVAHEFNNLDMRKYIKETSFEFSEWACADNLSFNVQHDKNTLYNQFVSDYQDFKKWLTQKRFSQWLDNYATFKEIETVKGKTMNNRWILFKNEEEDLF